MANGNNQRLKAFVRFDGTGRVVAGSLILRKKLLKWVIGKKLQHTNVVIILPPPLQQWLLQLQPPQL